MNDFARKVITVEVSLELATRIEQMAAKLQRSPDWIGEQALTTWITHIEEAESLMEEALEDIRTGRVIDHQAVQAWADSLDSDNPLPLPVPR